MYLVGLGLRDRRGGVELKSNLPDLRRVKSSLKSTFSQKLCISQVRRLRLPKSTFNKAIVLGLKRVITPHLVSDIYPKYHIMNTHLLRSLIQKIVLAPFIVNVLGLMSNQSQVGKERHVTLFKHQSNTKPFY